MMELGDGQTVVDVGCGPGFDAVTLARSVGDSGRVIGIDADPEMVKQAAARVQSEGCAENVMITIGNALQLPLPDRDVDACRSERLLMHLRDPERAVSEMARITRPGGRVVCIEPDWGTLSIDCDSVHVERRLARFTADSALANGYAGRRLHGLFGAAGLVERKLVVLAIYLTDYELTRYLVCFERTHEAAIAAGIASRDELQNLYRELESAQDRDCFFGTLTLVVAAGRVPN